jgi:hypothetical protein
MSYRAMSDLNRGLGVVVIMGVSAFLGWELGGRIGLPVGIAVFFGLGLLFNIHCDLLDINEENRQNYDKKPR